MVVSLVGTFAVMRLMGFTLNNLTLFGLVLAIGIVVDDAIVVLENIERWLAKGLSVRDATIKAMDEITGPILAITLVLSSVFMPSAFLGGITGQFFRQFALTISVSMIISAVNAMTHDAGAGGRHLQGAEARIPPPQPSPARGEGEEHPPPQPSPARGEGETGSLPPCGGGLGWGERWPGGAAVVVLHPGRRGPLLLAALAGRRPSARPGRRR